jgi:hypothetical protein
MSPLKIKIPNKNMLEKPTKTPFIRGHALAQWLR